jgi:hypothetical protein
LLLLALLAKQVAPQGADVTRHGLQARGRGGRRAGGVLRSAGQTHTTVEDCFCIGYSESYANFQVLCFHPIIQSACPCSCTAPADAWSWPVTHLCRQVIFICGDRGPMAAQVWSDHTVPGARPAVHTMYVWGCRGHTEADVL